METFLERIQVVGVSLLWSAIALFTAKSWGFFQYPQLAKYRLCALNSFNVLVAIALFFLGQASIVLLSQSVEFAFEESHKTFMTTDPKEAIQNGLIGVFIGGAILLFYTQMLPKSKRMTIWGEALTNPWREFFVGAVTWFFIFPCILVIGQIVEMGLSHFFTGPFNDQEAVLQLKETFQNPLLLAAMVTAIVTLVPFLEELLFRGFIQPWCVNKIGVFFGIIITSLIFASLHLSLNQGYSNAVVFVSLFVLSCCLGWLKIRRESLWAPIGLHIAFNTFSTLVILMQANQGSPI